MDNLQTQRKLGVVETLFHDAERYPQDSVVNRFGTKPCLLVVDDEPNHLVTLRDIFEVEGFQVYTCDCCDQAIEFTRDQVLAVAILDLNLGREHGIEMLRELRKICPDLKVIIHTGYGTFNTAKDAVNLGAYAYVEKSGSPSELVLCVHRALKERLSEALTRSEQQYLDLISDVAAIVWERDYVSRRFRFVNAQAEQILGYPAQTWMGASEFWEGCVHPDDRDRYNEFYQDCVNEGHDQEIEYRATAADGRTVWLHEIIHKVTSHDDSPTMLRGVMFDVTRQKKADQQLHDMETQLAHVSRLSTMGELVASIAHEINQPLAAISNFAAAAKHVIDNTHVESDAPLSQWMQTVCEQASSCADIIRDLRGFVKKDHEISSSVDLSRVIEDSVKLVRCNQRHRAARLTYQPPAATPIVEANNIQLKQVFVNLLQNACEAVRNADAPSVQIDLQTLQDRIRVTITDNGKGIDPAQRDKVFDAFYTTNPNGMGMGLAISKTIVESHKGTLKFDSDARGTRFHVLLPLADSPARATW